MTGSGKTQRFSCDPDRMGKPRGVRGLVHTPTRELAADRGAPPQSRATPLSGAAVFGGGGMGPRDAFRKRRRSDHRDSGRLLDI